MDNNNDNKLMRKKQADYIAEKIIKKYHIKATPGRKRPRNPQERETLLRWERERDGDKIGDI